MSSFNVASPLFWVGSKRWQLSQLREWYEPHRRWVEPFCGGASLAFGLEPKIVHLNDLNPHLMNFYRWLQRDGNFVPVPPVEDTKDTYLRLRSEFNAHPTAETNADAVRFYLLNQMGYKGLWRVNRSGQLNTPYGYRAESSSSRYVKYPNVTIYRHLMQHWTLSTGSYANIERDPTDFLYVDPPYDTEFTGYVSDGFSWDDQVAVAQWCAAHSGPVVLCNQATPRIVALYTHLGFTLVHAARIERMRTIAHGSAAEVIALRNVSDVHPPLF